MHQTFYIDIDEEITSIVDRLRKAKSREVVIVVPKRALLIQSIVNLKLLKKESERLKKEIIVVTQDKLGKLLIEKTGIVSEQSLEDIGGEEVGFDDSQKGGPDKIENLPAFGLESANKNILENLGSSDYFDENPGARKNMDVNLGSFPDKNLEKSKEAEKIVNQELVVGIGKDIRKAAHIKNFSQGGLAKNLDMEQSETGREMHIPQLPELKNSKEHEILRKKAVPESDKEEKFSDFLRGGEAAREKASKANKQKNDHYKSISLSGKIKKSFWIFGLIIILITGASLAYLFLPKASIKISLKTKTKSADVEIKGLPDISSADAEKQAVPAKTISLDDEISKNFETTGNMSSNNQRARGIITIYNEYSESPQPLVATTRFMDENGKIFRLVKGVIIPGTSKVGTETKPGAIEAEVVADEAGEQYNIGPSKFTIPGFQSSGGEKYAKFYAKSSKDMVGGGSKGETIRTISNTDISNAKSKVMEELNKSIREKIKKSAGDGAVVLDDAIEVSDATYTTSASTGEAVDNFDIIVRAKAKAIVFQDGDAKEIAAGIISKQIANGTKIKKEELSLQFGKSDTDFSAGTIFMRANASGKIIPEVDIAEFKKNIIGKSEDEFKAYLKDFESIDSAEIIYWPAFFRGKIPAYESRVEIALDNN